MVPLVRVATCQDGGSGVAMADPGLASPLPDQAQPTWANLSMVSQRRRGRLMTAGVSTCHHCGERIVRTYTWCPGWTHQVEGAAFQDGQHWHCRQHVAEPIGEDSHGQPG